ncbi:DUF541 domain-containing protein [Ottowia sp. GY511]|uniref:SIMPL domain-containing protein n=1 Tax=Ottowia flava TaxID=2675430 RepID=A0ABW4KY66_9BURK|nr:SIMPL domain-containing protein [Ottowia sp. GY511]TXK26293.1 DUF541 domain-containing protein [Ottowia sp. GY511]
MKLRHVLAAASFFAMTLGSAQAQPGATSTLTMTPPQNVLQLSATGLVEVQQDLLTLSLSTTREGADANTVQNELRKAVDAAMNEVKKTAQREQMDVRSGDFNVHPRYARDGKINGWQGRAEIVLEGRDFPRITQAAARVPSMTIGNIEFGLSREARGKVEGEAQAMAIERFKARAGEIAKAFGFAGYTLREVSVSGEDSGYQPRMMAMAKEMRAGAAADAAPVPIEPGKSVVRITVSGSVQAH